MNYEIERFDGGGRPSQLMPSGDPLDRMSSEVEGSLANVIQERLIAERLVKEAEESYRSVDREWSETIAFVKRRQKGEPTPRQRRDLMALATERRSVSDLAERHRSRAVALAEREELLRDEQLKLRHAVAHMRVDIDELRLNEVVARSQATVAQARDDMRVVEAEIARRRRAGLDSIARQDGWLDASDVRPDPYFSGAARDVYDALDED